MTKSSPAAVETWQFATTRARLSLGPLHGEVVLDNPSQGIGLLAWREAPLVGQVLGVSAGATAQRLDAFTREEDLVAVYSQTEPQSFSWQVYWRACSPDADVVLVDVILSLQTPLLESFPQVTTCSQLPTGEATVIPVEGDCVVVRPAASDFSYAEMTHPKDRGTLQVAPAIDGQMRLQRRLGGHFLEKGVIRRLRLRGAFLPRNDDRSLANRYYEMLAAETPPLTA
jgi:hypothetical protein